MQETEDRSQESEGNPSKKDRIQKTEQRAGDRSQQSGNEF